MNLDKMVADACALRMRQLSDWQADAAKRSDEIRALLDVLGSLPCRVSLGGLAYVSVSILVDDDADGLRVQDALAPLVGDGVWRCSDSGGGDSFVRLASGLPVYLFCGDV